MLKIMSKRIELRFFSTNSSKGVEAAPDERNLEARSICARGQYNHLGAGSENPQIDRQIKMQHMNRQQASWRDDSPS